MSSAQTLPMPPYPWLEKQWQSFVQGVEENRLAHALLISGPAGLGGAALARAMSEYLLCTSPTQAAACGRCRSCKLVAAESHPDILSIAPEASSSVIKIDQVRQVTRMLANTAQQGGRKVVLLQPAEAMNANAANALLKNLEEPAGASHLILVSYEPNRLLATIRSRCSQVALRVPSEEQALEWLSSTGSSGARGISDARELLARAGGEPLKLRSWFDSGYLQQQDDIRDALEKLAQGQISPMDVGKKWLDYDPRELVDAILLWLRDAVSRHQLRNGAPLSDLDAILAAVPPQWLVRYWDRLIQVKKQLLSNSNPNVELLLDELLLNWVTLCRQGRRRSA